MTKIKYGCRYKMNTKICSKCPFHSNDQGCNEYRQINERYILYDIGE